MSAIVDIPLAFSTQFEANWEMLAQQMESRLSGYVTLDTVRGKEKKYNQMGPVSMQQVTGRAEQTRQTDIPLAQRWLRPFPYDIATVLDEWDPAYLGDVVAPNSEQVQAHGMAYGRTLDTIAIAGLTGTAYTGATGVTPVTLDSTQTVAVDYVPTGSPANSGLTLAKLIQAKSILGKNEADTMPGDEMIFAYTQKQLDDLLLNVDQVSNTRYSDVKALIDGKTEYFMGFKFVKLQLLDRNTSTDVRTCIAYMKSGIKVATSGKKTYMDVLPTQSHALQHRSTASIGATRMQEKKVVIVYTDESP